MVKSRVTYLFFIDFSNSSENDFTRQKAGTLKNGRLGHGAIFDGDKFLIIGGVNKSPYPVANEVCNLEGLKMTCVEEFEQSSKFAYYPELFLVAADFGKDVSKC